MHYQPVNFFYQLSGTLCISNMSILIATGIPNSEDKFSLHHIAYDTLGCVYIMLNAFLYLFVLRFVLINRVIENLKI